MTWMQTGFELDINATIMIFLLLGLLLQGTPIAYADCIRRAAQQTGSMLLSTRSMAGSWASWSEPDWHP